jgi:hypothetical protein
MATIMDELHRTLAALDTKEINSVLSALVATHWQRQPWSNIDPQVIDTAKADVGVGLALFYPKGGAADVVLMKAAGQGSYQIAGGFMNLAAAGDASPQAAAAREAVEELIYPDGTPLLKAQSITGFLQTELPLDFNLISVRGQRRVVASYAFQLTSLEFSHIRDYASDLRNKPDMACALRDATKGEIDGIGIFPLTEVYAGRVPLRHPDQASLFKRLLLKLQ